MTRSDAAVFSIERAVAVVTVLVGWLVVLSQLLGDGPSTHTGTAWLLVLAAIATGGCSYFLIAQRAGQHGRIALGLMLAALSPTVFAYPLNAVLLVFAVLETSRLIAAKRHDSRVLQNN
jgi:hypothetical protein